MFENYLEEDMVVIQGDYATSVVILSILIAVIASYSALTMNGRAQRIGFFHRNLWLMFASIAMGFGIWSMHFVGMSAFSLPVHMTYNVTLTVLSIVPAMVASFIAFYLSNLPKRGLWVYILAGVSMGAGISTMHYMGMYAMKMDISYSYNYLIFIVSIGISVAISMLAVYIFSNLQLYMKNRWIQLFTALIMGLAVSSMHYTGMSAVTFYVPSDFHAHALAHDMGNIGGLVIIVTAGMALLLGILFLLGQIDRYVAYHTNFFDSFTKLPNRRLFEQDLRKHLFPEYLIIWQLHGLEELNKEYSYQFVDEVIKLTAQRFQTMRPPSSELYRIEENRFAFLMKDVKESSHVKEAMQRISEYLQTPLFIDGEKTYLSSVCAVAEANNKTEAATLYANALAVIRHSSTKFENEVIFFDPAIHTHAFEREIVDGIGRAIKMGELFLVYQPKVSLKGNQVEGLETLLRWKHPIHGLLSPALFIPILESHNRMERVTDWIIEQVCKQIASWREEGISFEQISINIPGDYVTSPKLLQVLQANMRNYEVSASQLELEITETSFVRNIEKAIQAVIAFRKEGLSVALDDFGTGVSSLSYLKKMPISTLKIDKSFIDEIPASEKDSSILEAMIGLGQSLKLTIVFEGVETKEQIEFLRNTCIKPVVQGYYYSKPQSSEEIVLWNQVHLATSKGLA